MTNAELAHPKGFFMVSSLPVSRFIYIAPSKKYGVTWRVIFGGKPKNGGIPWYPSNPYDIPIGSMYAIYMAIYGNMDPINIHQYTPVMLALIYQHQPDPSWDMILNLHRVFHRISTNHPALGDPRDPAAWHLRPAAGDHGQLCGEVGRSSPTSRGPTSGGREARGTTGTKNSDEQEAKTMDPPRSTHTLDRSR